MRTGIVLANSLLVLVTSVLSSELSAGPETSLQETAARRRPVAAVLIEDGQSLCVANRSSGSLSLIDLNSGTVIVEQALGRELSDIARWRTGGPLLVSDSATHELLVVQPESKSDPAVEVRIIQRIKVARSPESIAVSRDETTVAIASLWSRRITLLSSEESVDGNAIPRLQSPHVIRLPFSPRCQQFIDEGRRLVVADAFGGEIAVINVQTGELESTRQLPAQNLRGMTLAAEGQSLLITQQTLSRLARADFDDLHWGNLLRNGLREIPVESLLDPQADLVAASRIIPVGEVGNGAADPADIALLPALGGWMIAVSGTNEVLVRTRQGGGRVAVETRPTAIVWDADREVACVLCTLDDSVCIVDPLQLRVIETISLGPVPELSPADRGERLFVDARRSHDGWISCQSCHPDGHTTGGLADTESDNSYGTPKRILSLLGTRDSNPWAWNGQFRELHEQVARSFTSTLQGEPLPAASVSDVVAYLHTLLPPPAVDEGEWTADDQAQILRGRELFRGLDCGKCHVPAQTFTIDQTFDVGLQDEEGLRHFNPPSLRGLSHRRVLFHDGRADSLEAVFEDFGHQLPVSLSEEAQAALIHYLRSL